MKGLGTKAIRISEKSMGVGELKGRHWPRHCRQQTQSYVKRQTEPNTKENYFQEPINYSVTRSINNQHFSSYMYRYTFSHFSAVNN